MSASAGSLGRRMAFAVIGTAGMVAALTTVVAWFAARHLVLNLVDRDLAMQSHAMLRHLELPAEDEEPPPPHGEPPDDQVPYFWVFEQETHRVRLQIPSWPPGIAPDTWALHDGDIIPLTSNDGRMWRLICRDGTAVGRPGPPEDGPPRPPPGPPRQRMLVLRNVTVIHAGLAYLAWVFAAIASVATLSAAVATGLLQRVALGSLHRLAQAIAGLDPHGRQRIAPELVPLEVAPVVDRLNVLLARVGDLVARERRTTADIAHELRTPLGALRADLTLAQHQTADPAHAALFTRLDAQAQVLQRQVHILLLLTRIETGQLPLHPVQISLSELVNDGWAQHHQQAQTRGMRLACQDGMELVVLGDEDLLAMVFANLLGNAVAHGDAAGTITVRAQVAAAGRLQIVVRNPAAGLPPGPCQEAFTPFWRGDLARTGGHHSGLGLALCRRIVEAHHGVITAEVDAVHGFVIRLTLPQANEPG